MRTTQNLAGIHPRYSQECKMSIFHLRRESLRLLFKKGFLENWFSSNRFFCAQSSRHSEASAAMVQRCLAAAFSDSRCWYCPHDANFTSMQSTELLLPRGFYPHNEGRPEWLGIILVLASVLGAANHGLNFLKRG